MKNLKEIRQSFFKAVIYRKKPVSGRIVYDYHDQLNKISGVSASIGI